MGEDQEPRLLANWVVQYASKSASDPQQPVGLLQSSRPFAARAGVCAKAANNLKRSIIDHPVRGVPRVKPLRAIVPCFESGQHSACAVPFRMGLVCLGPTRKDVDTSFEEA